MGPPDTEGLVLAPRPHGHGELTLTPGNLHQIASLALSPNGHYLATYSLDSALIIYDVRPFSSDPMRVYRSLTGAPAGFEQTLIRCAWSKHDNGARIAAGGGDRSVTIWEVETGKILYKLPGHKGTVTGVDFHPKWVAFVRPLLTQQGAHHSYRVEGLEHAPWRARRAGLFVE